MQSLNRFYEQKKKANISPNMRMLVFSYLTYEDVLTAKIYKLTKADRKKFKAYLHERHYSIGFKWNDARV